MRWFWRLLAILALTLGAIGVVLPGLPTTPFILLAAFAAARGSPPLHAWLRNHRLFGPMIIDWQREGAVSRKAKRAAIFSMVICAAVIAATAPKPWMVAVGCSFMTIVGVWLWRRPEPKPPNPAPDKVPSVD